MKQLVVVGIDPGTTIGYAILGLDGQLIKKGSSKLLDINKLISVITTIGLPVVVASDKKKVPGFVERISTKLGARQIKPKSDMLVSEKKALVAGQKTRNDHERDALAAAISAYNKIKPLIVKIDAYIDKNRKDSIADSLRRQVIIDNSVSIHRAAQDLSPKPKPKPAIVTRHEPEISPKFLKLLDRSLRQKKELNLLYKQREQLKEQIRTAKKPRIVEKVDAKLRKSLEFKDRKLKSSSQDIRSLQRQIVARNKTIDRLQTLILDLDSHRLVKILPDLGRNYKNFVKQQKIKRGDIVLIKNPQIASQKNIEHMATNIDIVISEVSAKWLSDFIVLNPKNLNIREAGNIIVVSKASLEKNLDKRLLLKKIITDHKKGK